MRRPLLTIIAIAIVAALAIGGLFYARSLGPARNYAAEFDALAASMQPGASDTPDSGVWTLISSLHYELEALRAAQVTQKDRDMFELGPLYAPWPAERDSEAAIARSNQGLDLIEASGFFARTPGLRSPHSVIRPRTAGVALSDTLPSTSESDVRPVARALAAATARAFNRGRAAEAIDRFEEASAVAVAVASQPTIFDRLIAHAIITTATRPLHDAIRSGALSNAADLARADAAAALLLSRPSIEAVLEGERLISLDRADRIARLNRSAIRSRINEYFDAAIAMHRSPLANRLTDRGYLAARQNVLGVENRGPFMGDDRVRPLDVTPVLSGNDDIETDLIALRIMLALESERTRSGRYPESIDDLPAANGSGPLDAPRDRGHPLIYRSAGDSYTLYAAGDDQEDNGGTPHPDGAFEARRPGFEGFDVVYR